MKKYFSSETGKRIMTLMLSAAMTLTPAAAVLPLAVSAEETSDYVFSSYENLKELYKDDFNMGVACEAISHWGNRLSEIGNEEKEALMLKEFGSMTFGNELKPAYNMAFSSPEATETDLPFGANRAAIEMLDWAKENGMPVRGHTLIWHSQCEDNVFCKNYLPKYKNGRTLDPDCLVDKETMLARMESYINHVMEYMYANGYGNVIYAWDVVNEAIEPGQTNDMRDSYWYQILGDDFLMSAFKFAREAELKYSAEYAELYGVDPADEEALKAIQPKLFYNDYSEFQANKRDAIIKAITPIVEAGYLDGMGMQGHVSDTTDIDAFVTALNMYSAVVDEVQVTELDVSQSGSGVNAEYYQAVFYNKFFSALIDAKKNGANLTCVTIWGLTDDNSWKKETSPLIFNGDLTKKMAFDGIVYAKTGEELPEPEAVEEDLSDGIFTFDEDGANAQALGFTVRGNGSVKVQSAETYSGNGALLDSGRGDSWHGVLFDVSRFAGHKIRVHAWVKSEDARVKLTADIDTRWPNIASAETAGGDWAEINGTYTISPDLPALQLYFETNNKADIYVDELTISLAE
ncbi:MAG: endo-1,4-beta-xylanase [Clostridiales bacterium]|nr:endo-1,4-beta-xylanase [Candidatus Blautia equi]